MELDGVVEEPPAARMVKAREPSVELAEAEACALELLRGGSWEHITCCMSVQDGVDVERDWRRWSDIL